MELSQAVLGRIDIRIFKNKSGSDTAQVPANAASTDLYLQGATVSTGANIPVTVNDPDPIPTDVYLFHKGQLQQGDVVQQNNNTSKIMTVADVVDDTHIRVTNNGIIAFSLLAADRLVNLSRRPTAFSDPIGSLPLSSTLTADAIGRVAAYIRECRFDYIITGTGITSPRLYIDVDASPQPTPTWLSLDAFPSLQAAITALPLTGGEIFIPAGEHLITAPIVRSYLTKPVMG